MTGRLIINARGESAKAIATDGGVRVQMTGLNDSMSTFGDLVNTMELRFSKREVVALALQILDAAGYAATAQARAGSPSRSEPWRQA